MSITQNIAKLQQQKAAYEQSAKEIKVEFAQYITDKSVPVLTRWKVFSDAPIELRTHQPTTPHFNSRYLRNVESHFSENGKYVIIDLIYEFNYHWVDLEAQELLPDRYFDWEEENLEEALEEILAMNLGSYKIDW
jgi:hypothetical protein